MRDKKEWEEGQKTAKSVSGDWMLVKKRRVGKK